jgi:hypothetical protein
MPKTLDLAILARRSVVRARGHEGLVRLRPGAFRQEHQRLIQRFQRLLAVQINDAFLAREKGLDDLQAKVSGSSR